MVSDALVVELAYEFVEQAQNAERADESKNDYHHITPSLDHVVPPAWLVDGQCTEHLILTGAFVCRVVELDERKHLGNERAVDAVAEIHVRGLGISIRTLDLDRVELACDLRRYILSESDVTRKREEDAHLRVDELVIEGVALGAKSSTEELAFCAVVVERAVCVHVEDHMHEDSNKRKDAHCNFVPKMATVYILYMQISIFVFLP